MLNTQCGLHFLSSPRPPVQSLCKQCLYKAQNIQDNKNSKKYADTCVSKCKYYRHEMFQIKAIIPKQNDEWMMLIK